MQNDHRHRTPRSGARAQRGAALPWVFLGFLAVAGFFLFTEHRAHLMGALPFLLLALCPLMHFFHGGGDEIIPADGSRQALAWFGELQGDATLDIAEGIGHELHPALIECALHRLTHHIPQRTWRAALGAASAARVAGRHATVIHC